MVNVAVVSHCSAQPENYAKFKWNFDYIVHGLAYGQLTFRQINNLIKTSGLSKCDKALLYKELDQRVLVWRSLSEEAILKQGAGFRNPADS